MRSWVDLAFSFALAALFVLVGVRAIIDWTRSRARPQAHLAWAMGLFGLNQLISAINQTLNDPTGKSLTELCSEPRLLSVVSSLILLGSMYAFLYFLADFLTYPTWARAGAVVMTVGLAALTIVSPTAKALDPDSNKLVSCPGAGGTDETLFNVYLIALIAWLVVVFGVLSVAFLRYGGRVAGLARLRMRALGSGFGLILIAVVLIPLILSQEGTTLTVLIRLIQILALASAPLLFIGFTPPGWLARRYPE